MRAVVPALVLLIGCAPTRSAVRPTSVRAQPSIRPTSHRAAQTRPARPSELASRAHLRCDDARCPAGVGMLVWSQAGELQRCTASLIGPDVALTASHCLPRAARHAGAACDGAWILFAATEERPLEWAQCRSVLAARAVRDEEVLRADVAVIRLVREIDREPLALALAPSPTHGVVSITAVRPHPIYPSQNELSTRRCRVATEESAVATYGVDAARVGWLMECPSYPGNSGAPVLDARGRIRAILHGGSAPIDGVGVTSSLDVPFVL